MTEILGTHTYKEHQPSELGVCIQVEHWDLIDQIKNKKELQGKFDLSNMEVVEVSLTGTATVFKFVQKNNQ